MLKNTRKIFSLVAMIVAASVWMQQAQAVTASGVTLSQATLKNTMNFDECMEFSVKPCVRMCPGFFGARPTVGIQPEYTEPTALIETSCLRGETQLAQSGGLNFINSMLAGSMMDKPDEQKCAEGIRSPGSKITRHYNEARVYGFSGPTRYLSSGSAADVTKSLTCGIAGAAGLFMDFSSMAGGFSNFSLANIGTQISQIPQQISAQVQAGFQQLTQIPQQIGGIIQDIPNMVTGALGGIADTVNGVTNGLSGLGTSLSSFGDLGGSLGNMVSTLQNIPGGDIIAGAVAPFSSVLQQLGSLQNLDLATLGDLQQMDIGQLTQYASNLGEQFLGIPNPTAEITAMGNSLQDLGAITTSSWQTAISNAQQTLSIGTSAQNKTDGFGLTEQLAADSGRASEHIEAWRHVKLAQYESSTSTSTEPVILSSFAPIGDVPEVTSVNDEMVATGRILNSGSTQVAAEMLQREFTQKSDFIDFYASEALRLTAMAANEGQAEADVCELKTSITKGKAEIAQRLVELNLDGLEIFPEGSYLPIEFAQRSATGEEASCIRTHAGYQLVPVLGSGAGTSRKNNINCIEVCPGDHNTNCVWRVKPGFKGSCEGNRLAQFVVDGKHPACANDRAALNTAREQTMRQNLQQAQSEIEQAERALETYMSQNKMSCAITSGQVKPTDAHTGMLMASAPLLGVSLSEQKLTTEQPTAALAPTTAQTSNFQLENAGFGGLTSNLNSVSAFTRKGGVQQAANNMIGKKLPFGLYPAFVSEATEWSQPPRFDIMGQIKLAVGSVTQAAMAPFMCLAPAHAADYGIIDTSALTKMNGLANCIGTWGAEHPSTGWSYHKDPMKAKLLAGMRGHTEALKFRAIQANTKGAQNFNQDYPFLEDGGSHRGSGCYNVGTGQNIGDGDLLNPDFGNANAGVMEIQDGKTISTMWKNTSCCIYFCGTFLGGAAPKVDRRY